MDQQFEDQPAPSAYVLIGGSPQVQAVVDRFFDILEENAAFADLRALHSHDLSRMRGSLAGFLIGWLGGPKAWMEAHKGVDMISAHAKVWITPELALRWTDAMAMALADTRVEPQMARELNIAFAKMASALPTHDEPPPQALRARRPPSTGIATPDM